MTSFFNRWNVTIHLSNKFIKLRKSLSAAIACDNYGKMDDLAERLRNLQQTTLHINERLVKLRLLKSAV